MPSVQMLAITFITGSSPVQQDMSDAEEKSSSREE